MLSERVIREDAEEREWSFEAIEVKRGAWQSSQQHVLIGNF